MAGLQIWFQYAVRFRSWRWSALVALVAFSMVLYRSHADSTRHTAQLSSFVYYLHFEDSLRATFANGSTTGYAYRATEFEVPMRTGLAASSRRLGTSVGGSFIVNATAPNSTPLEEICNTLIYDDGEYKGTITQQGVIDLSFAFGSVKSLAPPTAPGTGSDELAVVGGTGDFRCANGYSKFVVASDIPFILMWTVHLFYPCQYTTMHP